MPLNLQSQIQDEQTKPSMHKEAPIQTPITQKPFELLVPRPLNSTQQQGHLFADSRRVISNRMKGNKIHLSQYRQKQQLKTQSITHHNIVKSYLHKPIIDDYMPLDDSISQSHNPRAGGHGQYYNEFQTINTRPRTGGILTADPTCNIRKKRVESSQQSYRKKTMILTSSGIRPKTNTLRATNYFISSNLDEKMNEFMNLIIRNESKIAPQTENFIGQIHTQGVVPHNKKLNNFERKMKIKKKTKNTNSSSNSKEKVKINLGIDAMDMKTLSKTLQTISMHSQSPLVSTLEHKTVFGRLSAQNNLKRSYFHHKQ